VDNDLLISSLEPKPASKRRPVRSKALRRRGQSLRQPKPISVNIASMLSDMDAEIAALEARRDKTRALILQELLTGRIRLVSARHERSGQGTSRSRSLPSSARLG
jgi:hypothetical protein